jgi:anti-sigma regulatory factor (Ser/Thr protein kinase)
LIGDHSEAAGNRGGTIRRWALEPSVDRLPVLRAQVGQFARRWAVPPDEVDALLLVVNELVSNVIDHARTRCHVTLRLTRSTVRVLVSDRSSATPVLRPRDAGAVRGRGMQIIAALASQWGWTRHATGKTVWVRMVRAPA